MKNIKLVIFDLDGTLIDAYLAISRSFNYAMRKSGYPARGPLAIRRAVGWGDDNLLKPFVEKVDLAAVLRAYRRHHRQSLAKYSRLIPGAKRVLEHLKNKGYKLAVASNRPTEFSLILIKHLEIKRYFNFVLCADKLRHGKPHPEILNKIIRKFSLSPAEAVYVGDMAIDAQAGRRAGIRTIIVPVGSSPRSQVRKEHPYRIISRITGLLRLL